MKVSEVMTRDVRLIEPTQTIRDAAKMMAEMDAGIMPVREGDRLVGIISLGDIAVMDESGQLGQTVAGISQPGGQHSQTGGPRT